MLANIYDEAGVDLLRTIEAKPICGVDFCDRCGDCLYCYTCPCEDDYPLHVWIVYGEEAWEARNV